MIRNASLWAGAGVAGALLIVTPSIDLLLGAEGAGLVHVVVSSFGLVLLAVFAAASAR